ncbi:MAG: glycosyltransferase [Actinobacteria bacterium]|nr:glycosyltransferase [Actinomycetota bacterium]
MSRSKQAGREARAERSAVFVVWRAYQGRVDAMQRSFEYDAFYYGRSFGSRLWRTAEYLLKGLATLGLLARRRPPVLWLQLPPTPLLYVGAVYKAVSRDATLVADCHNSLFTRPWIRTPGLWRLLNQVADLALVHNEYVRAQAIALGLDAARCLVLETRPATPAPAQADADSAAPAGARRPWVLFPAGFDADEPIEAFLSAARKVPDITFVVTGDARRARGGYDDDAVPQNVVLAGWVDVARYKAFVRTADLILGLTLVEGIQLSVANEAVGYGKALVLSDTQLLRALFSKGAVYVKPDPDDIANGVRTALARRSELEMEAIELRAERVERWTKQAALVEERLRMRGGR